MKLLSVIKRNTNAKTFLKGEAIAKSKYMIYDLEYETHNDFLDREVTTISACVEGSSYNDYNVSIELCDEDITYSDCNCMAFDTYGGLCKHCVAVALSYEQECRLAENESKKNMLSKGIVNNKTKTSNVAVALMQAYTVNTADAVLKKEYTQEVELIPILTRDYQGLSLTLKIGHINERSYVVKSIPSLLSNISAESEYTYGKMLSFKHTLEAFTPLSRQILEFLLELSLDNSTMGYYTTSCIKGNAVELSSPRLLRFLDILEGTDIYYMDELYTVKKGNPHIEIMLELGEDDTVRCNISKINILSRGQALVFIEDGKILVADRKFSKSMSGFIEVYARSASPEYMDIDRADMPVFSKNVLKKISKYVLLNQNDVDINEYMPVSPDFKCYIDIERNGGDEYLLARLFAVYNDKEYNVFSKYDVLDNYRDIQKEVETIQYMQRYFAINEKKELVRGASDDEMYEFATDIVQDLEKVMEIFLSEPLKKINVNPDPKVKVNASLKAGMLELDLLAGEIPQKELYDLLNSYKRRKKYYRLSSGDFITLEDNGMAALAEMVEGLELDAKKINEGKVILPKYHSLYVYEVLQNSKDESMEFRRDKEFKSLIRDMKAVEDSDYEVPAELYDTLRSYQKTGYRWLRTLDDLSFGGILADDMGLGKTIQVITLLLSKRGEGTSLIVAPASLVYNWENEINKFAPSLKVVMATGGMADRKKAINSYRDYDVIITSYDLIRRDIDMYTDTEYMYEIIDEAQAIKNYTTKAAKAVKMIKAKTKYALTGTPIENSLLELFSIFDYIMPGFLGSSTRFKNNFEIPVAQAKDEIATKRLKRMIKPFIMRRLKTDVLKELPEKTENIVYSKMEGEQLLLYSASLQRLKQSIDKQTPEEFRQGKLQILAEITKLRQICCDPSLAFSNYSKESAKLDTCMELVNNALEGGGKVLLFSQFTSMLDIIAKRLEKDKIKYHIITGQTAKEKRIRLVEEFANDDTYVFLISLKAGGTGLNLTSANTVIHYDPWWNVAATNQATDRAHRIGQLNRVNVYKLIMKDTIEEKIVRLQNMKKDLIDQVITEGGVLGNNLTKEDLLDILE